MYIQQLNQQLKIYKGDEYHGKKLYEIGILEQI